MTRTHVSTHPRIQRKPAEYHIHRHKHAWITDGNPHATTTAAQDARDTPMLVYGVPGQGLLEPVLMLG